MIVQTLLSPTVPALSVGDTVGQALRRMAEHGVDHLPVVGAENRLAGIVAELHLSVQPPDTLLISLTNAQPLYITPDTHVFDAARLMQQHRMSILPVASHEGDYLGLVTQPMLFGQLAAMLATEEAGAIIVLEGEARDFSLAQLAHLIEQNDVRILSVSTEDESSAGLIRTTLKLNVTDTARVRAVMEHHGYRVVAVFDEADSDLQGRVEAFMRYLEV
jgi:acetoin utilization protein AcuB